MIRSRHLLAITVACGACSSRDQRIAECDQLVAVVGQLTTCDRLDRAQRLQLDQAAKSIEDGVSRLAEVGLDKAPEATVATTRQACAKQSEDIQRTYQKVTPVCLQ